MFCPYCANQVEDNARFCNACGKSLELQQPVTQAEQYTFYDAAPRRRWRPWMTVTAVVLGTVLGAGAIWGLLISGINTVTRQIMTYDAAAPGDSWADEILPGAGFADSQRQLMRTWSMTGTGYYSDSIWWLTFGEDELEVELQTATGTEDYGAFSYAMVGEDEFYIHEAGQAYTFEINDGGNMLTITPGLLSDGYVEYWFNFGELS